MNNIESKKIISLALLFLSTFLFLNAQNEELSLKLTSRIDKKIRFTKEEKEFSLKNPKFFTIDPKSIKIELKEVKEQEDINIEENNQKSVNDVIVTLDNIVNIARKLWDVVVDNQPISNIETKYAVAYPQGITSPQQLANWKRPKVYLYGFYADNIYGIRCVDVEYKVIFTYGGDYKGKGKFLTGVSVIPTKVDVVWGYRFDMHSYVPDSSVVNVGSSQNPIAAMQIKLTWKISTYVKDSTNTSVYYIQGDGYFSEIASPFSKEKGVEDTFIAPLIDNNEKIEKVFN